MPREAGKYLEDIVTAAKDVQEFLDRRDVKEYSADKALRASVERKLFIVGEAVAQIRNRHAEVAAKLPEVREIVAFRNILVHGYFALDHARVFDIAVNSLPDLLASDEALLERESD